ncbi:cadherin-like domain-containing protein, partial [Prauserella sp. ASG 168]|nr:cadherin-like domain-containing protein [Prauserella cavernicola]
TLPDELRATHADDPANGSVTVNSDGTITYTPDKDFLVQDTVRYTAKDPSGATVTGTVTVTTGLAATGTNVLPIALTGGALLVVGTGDLLLARRTRQDPHHPDAE